MKTCDEKCQAPRWKRTTCGLPNLHTGPHAGYKRDAHGVDSSRAVAWGEPEGAAQYAALETLHAINIGVRLRVVT